MLSRHQSQRRKSISQRSIPIFRCRRPTVNKRWNDLLCRIYFPTSSNALLRPLNKFLFNHRNRRDPIVKLVRCFYTHRRNYRRQGWGENDKRKSLVCGGDKVVDRQMNFLRARIRNPDLVSPGFLRSFQGLPQVVATEPFSRITVVLARKKCLCLGLIFLFFAIDQFSKSLERKIESWESQKQNENNY